MPTTAGAGAGPGRSQEPGIPSSCPIWVAGTQLLGPSSAAFPATLVENRIRNIGARTEIGTPLWDAHVPSSGLTPTAPQYPLLHDQYPAVQFFLGQKMLLNVEFNR